MFVRKQGPDLCMDILNGPKPARFIYAGYFVPAVMLCGSTGCFSAKGQIVLIHLMNIALRIGCFLAAAKKLY